MARRRAEEQEADITSSDFPGLSPAKVHEHTETAQRFLASAYDSVEAVLYNLSLFRRFRRDEGQSLRGRLTENEEDLLRAAILFAGAGLDATLKQLIRDTLPHLLVRNDQAQQKFRDYAAGAIVDGAEVSPRKVAELLVSVSPREALIDRYIYALTGPSLQSTQQVDIAASALGISNQALRRRIGDLRPLFVARNQIAHELDLQRPERPKDRGRRTRRIESSRQLAHEALEVGQLMVNEVVMLLGIDAPT